MRAALRFEEELSDASQLLCDAHPVFFFGGPVDDVAVPFMRPGSHHGQAQTQHVSRAQFGMVISRLVSGHATLVCPSSQMLSRLSPSTSNVDME
ncbi:MAG: hypothetical protein AUF76_12125 [Acidobacteria bacterium 13_1_20CM_2_65_9]|nr:MAG: hypothetical protein AUF76_12125 [Acidobacteria bacterium 13_1_20CM_2_65_9]